MRINEPMVAGSTREWLGGLGYAVEHGPRMVFGEPAAEWETYRLGDCAPADKSCS
jgi:hypothetical protein